MTDESPEDDTPADFNVAAPYFGDDVKRLLRLDDVCAIIVDAIKGLSAEDTTLVFRRAFSVTFEKKPRMAVVTSGTTFTAQVLDALQKMGPCKARYIAKRLGADSGKVSGILSQLSRQGRAARDGHSWRAIDGMS